MALTFVFDENLPRHLVRAVEQHNVGGIAPIDFLSVGTPLDLPLGSEDPVILAWAEREGRILVTRDMHTMPTHLANHLAQSLRSPGVLIILPRTTIPAIVNHLALIAHASQPAEWADQVRFIP